MWYYQTFGFRKACVMWIILYELLSCMWCYFTCDNIWGFKGSIRCTGSSPCHVPVGFGQLAHVAKASKNKPDWLLVIFKSHLNKIFMQFFIMSSKFNFFKWRKYFFWKTWNPKSTASISNTPHANCTFFENFKFSRIIICLLVWSSIVLCN